MNHTGRRITVWVFLSSSHNPGTSDPFTFAPTQMPTSMGSMGKHEQRRTQNVTSKKRRGWKRREMGSEIHWWRCGRRRGSWRRSWRWPRVRRDRGEVLTTELMMCKLFFVIVEKQYMHQPNLDYNPSEEHNFSKNLCLVRTRKYPQNRKWRKMLLYEQHILFKTI